MGLFDSGKQGNSKQSELNSGLPLPPPPLKNNPSGTPALPPVPLPKPQQKSASVFDAAPGNTIRFGEFAEKKAESSNARVGQNSGPAPFAAGLPQNNNLSSGLNLPIPDALPILPPHLSNRPENKNGLGRFPDAGTTYEEIPFFSDAEPDLNELPILDITDSEDIKLLQTAKYSELSKPLYVRTDHYSEVLATIDTIKSYVSESNEMIYSLENLKKNFEVEHRAYKDHLEDIQRKLIYIDKVLFEREGDHA